MVTSGSVDDDGIPTMPAAQKIIIGVALIALADRQAGRASEQKTFGERMVTSGSVDDDGIPTMPAAQKIIIGVALIALVAFIVYTVTR